MNGFGVAVFVIVSFGEFTGTVTVPGQFVPVQFGSPPPTTYAVLSPVVALAVGVTGIVKLTALPAPVARPLAIVHVTAWPTFVHVPGSVPIVRPVGIVSLIVDTAVVAAVPVFVTVIV